MFPPVEYGGWEETENPEFGTLLPPFAFLEIVVSPPVEFGEFWSVLPEYFVQIFFHLFCLGAADLCTGKHQVSRL